MASRVYIRRIDYHCVDKEISLTAEVHNKVFSGEMDFDIIGKRSGVHGSVTIGTAKDRRFNGGMKAVMRAELGERPLTEGDILVVRNIGYKQYSVEMFTEEDPEYNFLDEMCTEDRHSLIIASRDSGSDSVEVRQLIKYGVPGTGKSFGITEKIKETYPEYDEKCDSEYVFRTTLHPEYSYYDFVGSTYPIVNEDKSITYDFKPGIFTLALLQAFKYKEEEKRIFLVLEEMSRANVAAVFGDLFQLLDRDDDGESEYKIRNDFIAEYIRKESDIDLANNNIYLPSNLFIYGTVNTSDQNVFVMDNAFKRRFEFEYVSTEPVADKHNELLNEYEFVLDSSRFKWTDFYRRLNEYITGTMGLREDKQIGQFFLRFKKGSEGTEIEDYNYNQIKNKLLQYLWDDVHKCAMAERPLFREDISTFEDAYLMMDSHKNIFCQAFCDKFSPVHYNTELAEETANENDDSDVADENGDDDSGVADENR